MMNKRFFTIVALMLCALCGNSQEYLTGFGKAAETRDGQRRIERNDNVATLPFFDDFTEKGTSVSTSRWQSPCVLPNSGFPYKPVNYRAATLDLVDGEGTVYGNGSSNPFIADSLMSVAIRLDSVGGRALTPADSLYLSFYYQAGGYGNAPDKNDSLVVCFGYGYEEYIVDSVYGSITIIEKTKWKHIWSIPGDEFDSTFTKVMLPITDTCFFKERFYVLFYNYGTLPTTMYPNDRSNMDIWNIDFVYLNENRSILKEDSYPLVSLSGIEPQFLKRYNSMPYAQYKETSPEVSMDYIYKVYASNMDSLTHQVRYYSNVENNNSGDVYEINDTTFVLEDYTSNGIKDLNVLMRNFRFPDNIQSDSTSFTIRQYIEVIDQYGETVAGDSIVSKQGFYNYFAYDDGIPEMGYGLTPDDTYFATQFNVAVPDYMYGVYMLFNQTFNDANYNFFDIVVWGNNNGKPGEVIYTLENQRPEWSDDIYDFAYYKFEKPVPVNGTFYVGLRQQEKMTINIGFDATNDNSQYNFYKVNTTWENSAFPGSLMIRPMVGKEYFIGVEENQCVTRELMLYPNPAGNVLHIDGVDSDDCSQVLIYDVTGRLVMEAQYQNELNISELSNGIYVLRLMDENGNSLTSKFVVSK